MQIAIVEDTAPGGDLKRSLLLLGRAIDVIFVVHDLQPDQAATDDDDPTGEEE